MDLLPLQKGELGPLEEQTVRGHLEACRGCSAAWKEMGEVLDLLEAHPPALEAPDALWSRVQERVRLSRAASIKRRKIERPMAAGIIALLGVLCLLWLLKINSQVVAAMKETLASLGLTLPWLTDGPVSFCLAPVLFIALCSLMTLILSPLLLRKAKTREGEARGLEDRKAVEWKGS